MKRYLLVIMIVSLLLVPRLASAEHHGLFRTPPVYTPPRGTVWLSNATYYSSIPVNPVLSGRYGVTNTRILSSISQIQLGLTDNLSLTGSLPFNADMFKQRNRSGEKTGPGDVNLGFRFSFAPRQTVFRGFSIGVRANIPEKFGYGAEPLGFRTFSNGTFGYSIDMSMNLQWPFMDGFLSAAYFSYPRADAPLEATVNDVFYDSGFGYLGIGRYDATGFSDVIFQDQLTMTVGGMVPITSWVAGLFEFSTTGFTEEPQRDAIYRIAPGFRFGSAEGMNLSVGVDIGLKGTVPDKTYLMRFSIPSFRPASIVGIKAPPRPSDMNRSRGSLVAVPDFKRSDYHFRYESDLKNEFQRTLGSMSVVSVVPEKRVRDAYLQQELTPVPDTYDRLGVRLGANFVINADITHYSAERTNSFSIPFLIGFPQTVYTLTAQASVTDLVSGETRSLGDITAVASRGRGVLLFPTGPSSDLEYLTAPEQSRLERELIDNWVNEFNAVILDRIELFGWEPLRTELRGDVDTNG